MLLAYAKSPAHSRLLLPLTLLILDCAAAIITSLCTTLHNENLLPRSRGVILLVFTLAALTSSLSFLLDLIAYPLLWAAAPTRPHPLLPLVRIACALVLAMALIPQGLDALCNILIAIAFVALNPDLYHFAYKASTYVEDVGSVGSLLLVVLGALYFADLARRLIAPHKAPLLLAATLFLFAIDFLYAFAFCWLGLTERLLKPNPFYFLYYFLASDPLLSLASIAYLLTLITLLVRRPPNLHVTTSAPHPR
jgi:hypothetical protein